MTREPLAAQATRGGIVESVHLGDLAVVDATGRLIDSAGDPLAVAAFRSSAKPLQVGVLLSLGWEPANEDQLAIACGSHNGEPEHVRVVLDILRGAGLGAESLRTPAALPDASLPDVVGAAGAPAPVYHNCSGKHAAMLATCALRGWPLESYREPQHPLQHAIGDAIEEAAGTLLDTATDGCGVVTFAAPLAALARAFSRVYGDGPAATAAEAMRARPWFVAGTGRLCTDVMSSIEGLTVKVGAEGLVCAATREIAIAVKARDGARRAQGPFLLEALRRLGLAPEPLPDVVVAHARLPVTGGGRVVGEVAIRAR